jgi:hypothetical protein
MISQAETARKTETAAGKNAPAAMFYCENKLIT